MAVICTLPFYLAPSGQPQYSDYLLLVWLGVPLFWRRVRTAEGRSAAWIMVVFTAYAAACNAFWWLDIRDSKFLYGSAFHAFNAVILIAMVAYAEQGGRAVLLATARAFGFSLVLLAILSVPYGSLAYAGRLYLFFNNPNQLAYYCVCACTAYLLVPRGTKASTLLSLVVVLCALYLAVRSYSRAGILSVALLACIQFVRRPVRWLLLALPLLLVSTNMDFETLETEQWERKWGQVREGTAADYMSDRGLDRIIAHPEYLLLGAGEGGYGRFHPMALELHSSLATVFFCYGVPGLMLMLLLFFGVYRSSPTVMLTLAPLLMYGSFHNGLRFRPFWLTLAMAVVVASYSSAARASRRLGRAQGSKVMARARG